MHMVFACVPYMVVRVMRIHFSAQNTQYNVNISSSVNNKFSVNRVHLRLLHCTNSEHLWTCNRNIWISPFLKILVQIGHCRLGSLGMLARDTPLMHLEGDALLSVSLSCILVLVLATMSCWVSCFGAYWSLVSGASNLIDGRLVSSVQYSAYWGEYIK